MEGIPIKTIIDFLRGHYAIYSLLMIVKLVVMRAIFFHDYEIWKSLLVDGSFILFFLGFFELLFGESKWKKYFYLVIDALMSLMMVGVFLYVNWFNTMPNYFSLFELKQLSAISNGILLLLNPWCFLLLTDIVILVILMIMNKYPIRSEPVKYVSINVVGGISFLVCLVIILHFKGVKIDNSVWAAENEGIFNYELLKTYSGPSVPPDTVGLDMTRGQINSMIRSIKGLKQIPEKKRRDFGIAKGRNVIVVQAESFQNFLIGLKVGGHVVTPNLNRLAKTGFYFSNIYQQVGPGNTSDAEFMMNTSLYPISYSPTSIMYGDKKFPSLPRLLQQQGYETMTLHTGRLTFWNRDELYPALGFQKFYEQNYFGVADVVGMGSSDDILFGKGVRVLERAKQPFYAMFVTLSAHLPFKVPKAKQTLPLPHQFKGTMVGDYLQAQHYADAAFGRFVAELKKKGLWRNSILLFYGDHCGLREQAMSANDKKLAGELLGHSYGRIDCLNLPLIVSIPGKNSGEIVTNAGGQLDILPTLANLLGIHLDQKLVHFGQDLLNTDGELVGIRYYLPRGSFIHDHVLFVSNRGFQDGKAYLLQSRRQLKVVQPFRDEYLKVLRLEKLSDRYLGSLPEYIQSALH